MNMEDQKGWKNSSIIGKCLIKLKFIFVVLLYIVCAPTCLQSAELQWS
jgi:hypothetical protein